jgi:hypothetical protein
MPHGVSPGEVLEIEVRKNFTYLDESLLPVQLDG